MNFKNHYSIFLQKLYSFDIFYDVSDIFGTFVLTFVVIKAEGAKLDQSNCMISPGNFKHNRSEKIRIYFFRNTSLLQTINILIF